MSEAAGVSTDPRLNAVRGWSVALSECVMDRSEARSQKRAEDAPGKGRPGPALRASLAENPYWWQCHGKRWPDGRRLSRAQRAPTRGGGGSAPTLGISRSRAQLRLSGQSPRSPISGLDYRTSVKPHPVHLAALRAHHQMTCTAARQLTTTSRCPRSQVALPQPPPTAPRRAEKRAPAAYRSFNGPYATDASGRTVSVLSLRVQHRHAFVI